MKTDEEKIFVDAMYLFLHGDEIDEYDSESPGWVKKGRMWEKVEEHGKTTHT
jgi:hypothetical protein